jgi:hypothetical protein
MTAPNRDGSSALPAIRIDLLGIGAALKDRRLAVPAYQRSYTWEDGNVKALLLDLTGALDDQAQEYFLGSVVATSAGAQRLDVVDGQQRLATTTIIIAAIRDHFLASNDTETALDIEREHLIQTDIRTREPAPRLQLNEFDHDFFMKRILSRPDSRGRAIAPARESHVRLDRAAVLAAEHIANLVSTTPRQRDRILDLFDFICNRAKVIWVSVPDHANAFVIFETLNDRGLDLAISDLLKNHLFLRSDDRLEEIRQFWTSMLSVLETVDDERVVVDFIRHLWSSTNGATRERELFASIKRQVATKQAAIDFGSQLASSAKLYAAVLNPEHSFWNEYGPTARALMAQINNLRMIQLRPLLIATLARLSPPEVTKALRLMVAWGVRFNIVGGGGAGTLEAHYANRAKDVHTGAITSAAALAIAMQGVVPNDVVFQAAFSTATVSKAALARFYLQTLELQASQDAQPELVPNPNQSQVNLEHVLPQTPSDAWGHIPPDMAKGNYNRIGNLCLLRAGENSSLGNGSYEEKRVAYRASSLHLTSEIAEQSSWTIESIAARQRRLADLAVEAWSIRARSN